jgi:xylulokinase
MDPILVIACDVGTTGTKTCLVRIGRTLDIVASRYATYPLHTTPDGGVEQAPDDWWDAVTTSIRSIVDEDPERARQVAGLAFCCQMQGSLHVDREGRPLRNAMIYMDGRATEQLRKGLCDGWFKVQGFNAIQAARTLLVTGGLSTSPKDPVWKYHWVRDHQPELFARTDKWLDVKDYLVLRATGRIAMTLDSAHATFLFDTRPGRLEWHEGLCRTYRVELAHLPPVIRSTDLVGGLSASAAASTGLPEGVKVFGGGGDASLIPVGAGCVKKNDIHVYYGTSGWVIASVEKRMVDPSRFIASILGAIPGRYNYIAEMETAGYCLQWMRDKVLRSVPGTQAAADAVTYAVMDEAAAATPPGAGGVLYAPWLHGIRAPSEDPAARGMFVGVGLDTDAPSLVRAVMEGVAFHTRWMLEAVERNVPRQAEIRFVGGGARSKVWTQILADVTGRVVRPLANPVDAGALGAAIVCGVGLGALRRFEDADGLIPEGPSVRPRPEVRALYDRQFLAFSTLHKATRRVNRRLAANGG